MTLRPEQLAAVTRTGQDVCVVAGPGSGKTRVLVERFGWLVEKGTPPERVLAFTFTEKAATEIKRRLVQQFEKQPDVRARMERAWVSTMHGFCARLLRENAIPAGIDPQFAVLDELQAGQELTRAVEKALDELALENLPAFRALIDAISESKLAKSLSGIYEAMRIGAEAPLPEPQAQNFTSFFDELEVALAQPLSGWKAEQQAQFAKVSEWGRRMLELRGQPLGLEHLRRLGEFGCNLTKLKKGNATYDWVSELKKERIDALQAEAALECFRPQRSTLLGLLKRIGEIYQAAKRARAALDFADLEHSAIALLRGNAEICAQTQNLFDAVLMDEMQDTNPTQWQLVELLRRPGRFFAVGDINQSIYSFRHAEPEVFRSYRRAVEAAGSAVDLLRENHRTRSEILDAVTEIVGREPGIEAFEFAAQRVFDPARVAPVEAFAAANEDVEARLIAHRIGQLVGTLIIQDSKEREKRRPLRFSDIGVLLRKTAPMLKIEAAFREYGIPCVVSRGSGFYDAQEVTDLVRFLRVLENPGDEVSLAAVLRSPLVGVTDETLFRWKQSGNLFQLAVEPEERLKLARFREQLDTLRPRIGYVSPDRLVASAIADSDYESGLDERARGNVQKFLNTLREMWSGEPRPLRDLLDDFEALRVARSEAAAPPEDTANAVRMMSIHAAKGLEFPVVFLAALHTGVKTSGDAISYSRKYGIGVRWRMPGGGKSVADSVHNQISEQATLREKQESDRLLFVAMTRAEQHLALSWVNKARSHPRWPKLVAAAFNDIETRESAPDPLDPVRPQEDSVPVLLDRPARAGQYDSTASVTALVRFHECPRRYFLERYLGWQSAAPLRSDFDEAPEHEPRGGMDAGEFGSAVHAWLAGERAAIVESDVVELASRFEHSELGRRAAHATQAGRESDVIFEMGDLVLRGQIDLWFEEGGEVVIVDYKTDRFQAATRQQRLKNYAMQLRFYAAALGRRLGRKVDQAYLYLLRENVAEAVEIEDDSDLLALIRDFRASQESLDFPLHEGAQCAQCEFLGGFCPANSGPSGARRRPL
jgi:ATP-dependent helicase/nuclease subunit A